ncbi:MAG: class I SAM-dependent methyltransferase [Bacteroidetes bacterium]|nr:class I SAM-dependent methyltransferase [Bacteroidota bacterium]
MIITFTPKNWKDYQLIDSGNFEKLEKFGKYTLRRPEPQAIWKKSLSENDWKKQTDAMFVQKGSHSGNWFKNSNFKEPWELKYKLDETILTFKLNLTSFKHVGIFPEQAENWDFIYSKTKIISQKVNAPKILNLFAYTGGASLAAKAAGADVTHVDSVKQVINKANENQKLSGLSNIRWVIEDAMKFAERESNRGNLYNGIVLDPPAYGIGAKGERWKLEDMIDNLLGTLSKILTKENNFFVLNSYSLGFSSIIIKNLIESNFNNLKNIESGELILKSKHGFELPLGVVGRFFNA